jgi:phosphoglycerol transferase MdoB-like AlkP superfamily enzyme
MLRVERKRERTLYNRLLQNICYFILPFIALFSIEWIHRGSFVSVLKWFGQEPVESFFTYSFLLAIFSIFLLINMRVYWINGVIVTTALWIFSFISKTKQAFRDEPLLPADLLLASEANEVNSYLPDNIVWILSISVIVFLISIVCAWKFSSTKMLSLRKRVVIALLSLGVVLLLWFEPKIGLKQALHVEPILHNQRLNYETNGLLLGFMDNFHYLDSGVGDNYSKQNVLDVLETTEKMVIAAEVDVKPNVIMIMNESFMDPTLLPNVKYNKDPIPFVHELQKNGLGGNTYVSIFGGNTANSEFEALTGMSTQLVPPGVLPYVSYIDRPTPSIAWQFRQAGYETTAVAAFHHWFFNINNVYKNFGFHELMSAEFFVEPKLHDVWKLKDETMTDIVLKKLKEDEQTNFIFATTMQNHGPYPKESTESNLPIQVDASLSKKSKATLESYVNSVHEADAQLKRLTEELSKIDEPTIVMFFGDHLPGFGDEEALVFDELNYFNDITDPVELEKKKFQTPLVVWSNYFQEQQDISMSASFLGGYILEKAGIRGNAMTDFMNTLRKEGVTRIPPPRIAEQMGVSNKVIDNYRLLQHDILFGEMYGVKDTDIPVTDSYELGIWKPRIINVQKDKGNRYIVNGENFSPYSRVVIDDVKLDTVEYISANQLGFTLDKKDAKQIKVGIFDSEGVNIHMTNTIDIN